MSTETHEFEGLKPYAAPSIEKLGSLVANTNGPYRGSLDGIFGGPGGFQEDSGPTPS